MTTRADEERAACRASADDPRLEHAEAVGAYLLGHVRDNNIGWTCSCGYKGRLGESYEHHRADGILALLARRGWRP